MNLVQKLPIGLSLACLMFMSSCSKEDAQTPEPKAEGVNAHSGLKENGFVVLVNGTFPSTQGPMGEGILPLNWERSTTSGSNDTHEFPTGTSGRFNFFGLYPWTSFPQIAGAPDDYSFVSVSSMAKNYGENQKLSVVKTKIKYLIPGKKYAITFRVGSNWSSVPMGVAKEARVTLKSGNISSNYDINFAGFQGNKWITKTVTFYASATEAELSFCALNTDGAIAVNETAYAHILVEKDAIKKLN